jgi:hypothetical protein
MYQFAKEFPEYARIAACSQRYDNPHRNRTTIDGEDYCPVGVMFRAMQQHHDFWARASFCPHPGPVFAAHIMEQTGLAADRESITAFMVDWDYGKIDKLTDALGVAA